MPGALQPVFSTLRTTRSVLEGARVARVEGEAIRFWQESSWSWWGSESYRPILWRVYAATFEGSKATERLSRSKAYRQIPREELEASVGLPTAKDLWAKIDFHPFLEPVGPDRRLSF